MRLGFFLKLDVEGDVSGTFKYRLRIELVNAGQRGFAGVVLLCVEVMESNRGFLFGVLRLV
jgi:hypothetical protein